MSIECNGKSWDSDRGNSASPVKFLIIPVRTPIRLLQPKINAGLDEANLADDEASEDEASEDGDDMELSSLDDIEIWNFLLVFFHISFSERNSISKTLTISIARVQIPLMLP
jgi:hypothetical protein